MTTAFIAQTGSNRSVGARVALFSRRDCALLVAALAQHGHQPAVFAEPEALRSSMLETPFDLVLHDDDLAMAIGDPGCPLVPLGSMALDPGKGLDSGWETVLQLAVALAQSHARCRDLERTVEGIHTGNALVGRSAVMRRLVGTISRAAHSDATILIEGAPGTGKSLVARMVHCQSRRSKHPLVALDAATTTSEALGKVLGEASATTLILEGVERLPAAAQAALVRHLKERSPTAGPRIVVTTSAHLPELVARGGFREDLLYRLHALPIRLPTLRERTEDIAPLALAFASTCASAAKVTLTPAAISQLEAMPWPGNVAQLEAVVHRAVLLAGGGPIDREHVAAPVPAAPAAAGAAAKPTSTTVDDERPTEESILPFEQEEQRMLSRALSATKGNVRRAAQLLGIGRATLYRKIQQYQLRLQ
jgi:DNA-binding NtrC family response regulator